MNTREQSPQPIVTEQQLELIDTPAISIEIVSYDNPVEAAAPAETLQLTDPMPTLPAGKSLPTAIQPQLSLVDFEQDVAFDTSITTQPLYIWSDEAQSFKAEVIDPVIPIAHRRGSGLQAHAAEWERLRAA